ncbi:MAG: Holliday junction resolvase RuvX [Candidatus Ventricola sp.]
MNERIVALDVGDRRIGIAVSDPLGITAQPIETYTRVGYGPDTRRIAQLAQQYDTNRILCGLPLNMDGTQGFQTQKVREFAAKLEEAGLTVEFYDERMTTVLAEDALLEADMRRENRKKKVDMVAAVMILQSYLDAQAAKSAAAAQEDEEEPEDDGLLEMEDEDGQVIRFRLSATIAYAGETYVLLSCEEAAGGFEQGESLIMLSTTDSEGESCYQSLEDEALIEAVYEAYLKQTGGA